MTRRRKTVFSVGLILLPFVLILTLEGLLRLFGLFVPEPFIVTAEKQHQPVYQFNPWVTKRYFNPEMVTLPAVSPETFSRVESANTFRIFCLGGSTTAGFPFDCQVPFPVQLRYLLSETYPDYQFEVLNAGISAVNSFTVLDLLPDILRHDPDLILIYMGHNEFYGAYGTGSTIAMGTNGAFVRFYLKLQRLHLTQMMKSLINSMTGKGDDGPPPKRSLMAQVVKDQEIKLGSEKYRKTLRNFEENLSILLEICEEKQVPVLLGNLVCNMRDLPPFASAAPELTFAERERYDGARKSGDSLLLAGQPDAALKQYETALSIDSTAAELWFKMGTAQIELGDSVAAKARLEGARDRDLIRFRASSDANEIISNVGRKHGVRLVDIKSVFEQESEKGVIGDDLICDHLHPNPDGYYLMARAFYDAIGSSNLLTNPDLTFKPATRPYFVSDLDWDIGLLKILEMIHRWPFEEQPVTYSDYVAHGDPVAAEIARHYLFEDNVWSAAKYKMAEVYSRRGDLEKARNEYLSVTLYAPDDPYPYLKIAETYEREANWRARESFLRKALPLPSSKGHLFYQIAISQWRQRKLIEACQSMGKALGSRDLNPEQRKNALFYLAGFHADLNDLQESRRILAALLKIDPAYKPAHAFLQKLRDQGKVKSPLDKK